MDEAARQRQFEDQFLAQLRARALVLTRGKLPADEVIIEPTPEGIDAVRAELSRLEVFDRRAIDRLAGTRSVELRFQKRVLGGLMRNTLARLRVRVLTGVEALLNGQPPQPMGREQVLDALARYDLLPRRQRPSAILLASPTGFTAEAKRLVDGSGPPTLILMGAREDGGWDTALPAAVAHSPWARLFELEGQDERLKRLLYHLEQSADLVDSRGISVRELADKLGLPRLETERLVRQACRTQPHLMTVVHDGRTHVCRTPLAEEGEAMSMWSRIRRLLRLRPTPAERVRVLTMQRVRLEQQRFEADRKTDALEAEERTALQAGAKAASDAERRQIAARLVRVRRELKRHRAQAQLYTNQIDVIGTQIHHLTLTEQGKRVALPSAEELTAQAAEAEQVMAELAANAELANSIEVTGQTVAMADEMDSILEEFKQVAAESSPAPEAPAREPAAAVPSPPLRDAPAPARETVARGDAQREKPESARPEIG